MEVQVTARHCTIPENLRKRAEDHARRLRRYETRVVRTDIIFDANDRLKQVEARVFVGGSGAVVANGAAQDFSTALNHALDRATRQLKRRRSRRRNHQAVKLAELPMPVGDA
jgi:ribosomal subunit interface protein